MQGKEKIANKNVQRYAFQLTINNALDYGFDHHNIKGTIINNFTTIKYFCMADEIGENGTPHTHIYVCFSSRVRWSTLKKHFEPAHIEVAHGTVQNNIDYIKKTGKWEKTDKSETRVEGTFEEWGTIPKQKGQIPEMEELLQLIKDGYSNMEILELNNDYILNIEKLDRIRTTYLIDKYRSTRRLDLKVVYISGNTGLGKTRGIFDTHGDENVYRINDYKHPFDHYSCEAVLAFDEFRSSLSISDMLNYCDIYPIQLPSRYSNKYACFHTVYIVSNLSLEEQYMDVQKESPETWRAFLRRIHEVRIYKDDETVDIYDSADKYLKRDEEFHSATQEEENNNPFVNPSNKGKKSTERGKKS